MVYSIFADLAYAFMLFLFAIGTWMAMNYLFRKVWAPQWAYQKLLAFYKLHLLKAEIEADKLKVTDVIEDGKKLMDLLEINDLERHKKMTVKEKVKDDVSFEKKMAKKGMKYGGAYDKLEDDLKD